MHPRPGTRPGGDLGGLSPALHGNPGQRAGATIGRIPQELGQFSLDPAGQQRVDAHPCPGPFPTATLRVREMIAALAAP